MSYSGKQRVNLKTSVLEPDIAAFNQKDLKIKELSKDSQNEQQELKNNDAKKQIEQIKHMQSAPFILQNETFNVLLGDSPTIQMQKFFLNNLKKYVDRINHLQQENTQLQRELAEQESILAKKQEIMNMIT